MQMDKKHLWRIVLSSLAVCLLLYGVEQVLNVKAHTIINSWIMHGLADAAIIVIGLKMFALI